MSAAPEPEVDPYELLGITTEATEAEIRRAYRQTSLKVHPDRVRGSHACYVFRPHCTHVYLLSYTGRTRTTQMQVRYYPILLLILILTISLHARRPAAKFHELNTAYSLLLDPLRRLALDNNLRVKHARHVRFSAFEGKRKEFQRELEEREREFKRQRMEKAAGELRKREEAGAVMEQGRRMMEERQKERQRRAEGEGRMKMKGGEEEREDAGPVLRAWICLSIASPFADSRCSGDLDTTVRVKWSPNAHANLTTPASLEQLLARFGPIDVSTTVLSLKSSKNPDKPLKHATALVPFQLIVDAVNAVNASGKSEKGLDGIEISWAEGREPQIVTWLRKQGQLGTTAEMKEASQGKAPVVSDSHYARS